jgi:hypothetical protein
MSVLDIWQKACFEQAFRPVPLVLESEFFGIARRKTQRVDQLPLQTSFPIEHFGLDDGKEAGRGVPLPLL